MGLGAWASFLPPLNAYAFLAPCSPFRCSFCFLFLYHQFFSVTHLIQKAFVIPTLKKLSKSMAFPFSLPLIFLLCRIIGHWLILLSFCSLWFCSLRISLSLDGSSLNGAHINHNFSSPRQTRHPTPLVFTLPPTLEPLTLLSREAETVRNQLNAVLHQLL